MRTLDRAEPESQKKDRKMKYYYAKVWTHGPAITEEIINNRVSSRNVVDVYRFDNRNERDALVDDYRPPNHCPRAYAEAVKSSDMDVRRLNRTLAETNWNEFRTLQDIAEYV